MKDPICEMANEPDVGDERWRLHAAGCRDCREMLSVAEWMAVFAANTPYRRVLPAAGYLLFKARLQERLSAVDRAARPVNAMMKVMGVLLAAAAAIGVAFGKETRFAAIMIEAFSLLSAYVWVLLFAAVIAAAVCWVAAYFGDLKKSEGNQF